MRIATWNMKQAVAPKKKLDELWHWLESSVAPDIAVLTEAKVPSNGPPDGWTAISTEGGIGPRRRWGTVIAARGVEIVPITEIRGRKLVHHWPATVQACEVRRDGAVWGAVVGIYSMVYDAHGNKVGHGGASTPIVLQEIAPVLREYKRVVVAGDLNLWPSSLPRDLDRLKLIDLIDESASTRSPLVGCSGCRRGAKCGHMWTHRNGNSPNAAVQQIDYIFASRKATREVRSVFGGIAAFPDAWDVSDHAPVVADFA